MEQHEEEPGEVPGWRLSPPSVAAVIVSHEGERWLPQVLTSLAELDHLPNKWVAVNVTSTDGTKELLTSALSSDSVITVPSGTGFGDCVRAALDLVGDVDWLWLLHDDAIVDPSMLSALLDDATVDPDIAVVGPKIREWPSLRRMLEMGVTITSTGSRETGLEPGEPDAGQYDWPQDVLAVSTAGMLVRRDVWEELGGLDPELPLFFDDIDFGWRVSRAGYRVRYAPDAIEFHAEASRRRLRRRTPHAGEQRAAAVYTILANETGPRFWWQSLRLFIGTLLRIAGSALVRDSRGAAGEFAALRRVYLSPGRMRRARSRRKPHIRRARGELRELFPSALLPYQHGLELTSNTIQALVKPETMETAGRRSAGESMSDEDEFVEELPPLWRRYPWLVSVLVLLVLSLLAGRSLFGGTLSSAVLPPSPGSVAGWWSMIFSRFHDVGLGSTSWAPAYLVPLATVASPIGWAPGFVPWALLVFVVPIAAMTAHRFGRLISPLRLSRKVWAVSYALAIVASGAVAQGRIGTVVVLALLPVVANAATRLLITPSWHLTFLLALWTAVTAAFAPIFLIVVLLAVVGAGFMMGWPLVSRHWTALGVAAALNLPTIVPWLLDPSRWLEEAGRTVTQHAGMLDLLAGHGGGSGSAPWWASVPVVLLALLALFPSGPRAGVAFCWMLALGGLLMAVVGRWFGASWVGLGATLWIVGLATAILMAAPVLVAGRRGRARAIALVLAAVFPVIAGGWWVARGVDDPLTVSARTEVPAYLAESGATTAVLTGSVTDGVHVSVHTGYGTLLGQERMEPSGAVRRSFTTALQALIANPTQANVRSLAHTGVNAIYLPAGDDRIERSFDSAPGLDLSGSDRPGARVWIVDESLRDNTVHHDRASLARPVLAAVWVAGWVLVLLGSFPVRVREEYL